jgi:hypothetical protein
MGRKEYGIRLKSVKDAIKVLEVIKSHNNYHATMSEPTDHKVGEFLDIIGYLNFQDDCWLVLMNHGGASYTSEWFSSHLPRHIRWCVGSENLPDGWFDCNDFIWKNTDGNNQIYELPRVIVDYIQQNTLTNCGNRLVANMAHNINMKPKSDIQSI